MDILANHKDLITVEVTLNHLSLAAPDCYEALGAFSQMNPPVRDISHQMVFGMLFKMELLT